MLYCCFRRIKCALLAFSAIASLAAVAGTSTAELKFGVCSDLHLGPWNKGEYFERACRWWKNAGVDAIVIAGDLADCGDLESVGYVRDAIGKTFGDKWPEVLVCWGNHDFGGNAKLLTKENKERVLRDWFRMGETAFPTYLKKVKGYTFIGSHFQDWRGVQDLDAFLTAHADETRGPKPFFYFQHPHPYGTCYSPWVWGQDDGKSTAALARHPNAVVFSGHSHVPLTDERSVWQGAFTSVGTASMSFAGLPSGRENGRDAGPGSRLPALEVGWAHHALLATVYADRIVLERREFQFSPEGDELGAPWVVPLDGTRPFAFDKRAAAEVAPAFAADARMTVTRRKGPRRDAKLPEEDQWLVTFPTARAHEGRPRAYDYEVTAVCQVDDVEKRIVKRVWSKWCFLEEQRDPEAECVFGVAELPPPGDVACSCDKFRGTVRFEVRPAGPFGKLGAPLVSETYPRGVCKP